VTETSAVDVVDILTADHHEVLDLIATIEGTTDLDARRDIADTVIAEIVRHSVAEEMYVYPAMRKYLPDGDAEVEHDIEEHKTLEKTMKMLESVSVDDAAFLDLVGQLAQLLLHHATDEEQNQFPQLREAILPETLRELGEQVTRAKAIAPTRPHPASPNVELFHKTIGPGVGLVDKLRDAVSGRARNV
jgi:hemerythrin superfamily protein